MADGEGGQEAGAVVLPEDHLCSRCGYPSGRSGSAVCPECGWEATAAELEALGARKVDLAAWRSRSKARRLAPWLCAILLASIMVGLLTRWVLGGVLAVVWLGPVVSLSMGWVDIRLRRGPNERAAYAQLVWERLLWRLHLPWLVLPGMVGVAAAFGAVEALLGGGGQVLYRGVAGTGLVIVGVGCVSIFVWWWQGRRALLRRAWYTRATIQDAAAVLSGLLVLGMSGIAGVLAWVVAVSGVAVWFGLPPVF